MTVNLPFLILSKINLKHIIMKITARVLHKTIETIKIWTPNMSSIICVRDTSHCFTRDLVIIPDNRNAGTLVDWQPHVMPHLQMCAVHFQMIIREMRMRITTGLNNRFDIFHYGNKSRLSCFVMSTVTDNSGPLGAVSCSLLH